MCNTDVWFHGLVICPQEAIRPSNKTTKKTNKIPVCVLTHVHVVCADRWGHESSFTWAGTVWTLTFVLEERWSQITNACFFWVFWILTAGPLGRMCLPLKRHLLKKAYYVTYKHVICGTLGWKCLPREQSDWLQFFEKSPLAATPHFSDSGNWPKF